MYTDKQGYYSLMWVYKCKRSSAVRYYAMTYQ